MKGGRVDPDSVTDRQCTHCGLWFTAQGIGPHEDNCRLADMDVVVLPVVDESAADVLEDSPDPSGPEGATQAVDVDAGEGATPDEPRALTVDEGATVTDGGRAMAPPEPDVDPEPAAATSDVDDELVEDAADAGDDDEHDDVECPTCGQATGDNPDDLEDGALYRCPNDSCGSRFRWRAGA